MKCLQTKGEPETVSTKLMDIYPWIECSAFPVLEAVVNSPSPRIFKSHGSVDFYIAYSCVVL